MRDNVQVRVPGTVNLIIFYMYVLVTHELHVTLPGCVHIHIHSCMYL